MTSERPVGSTPTHYLVDEHYQPQPDLRALAAAADKGGEHIYTHWRDSNSAKANEAWHRAASPDLVIGLLDRIAELEAQHKRKPLKVAALDTRPVIGDDELTKAFAGTNFGSADHRQELHVAVLKKASGYHCGHTITTIMRELRLINTSGLPTKKGRRLISLAFHALMVGGP